MLMLRKTKFPIYIKNTSPEGVTVVFYCLPVKESLAAIKGLETRHEARQLERTADGWFSAQLRVEYRLSVWKR